MVTRAGAARWARDLDQVVGRIAPRFARAEPRRRAGAYLGGCWRRLSARAASRWSVESRFEQAKDEVGPGHHAMRSWLGGHRHVTLSMLALAHLAAVRKAAARGADPAELAAVLLPLGDDIAFLCGHGPASSFGQERLRNPFLGAGGG